MTRKHPIRKSDCRADYHPSIHKVRQVFVDGQAIHKTFFFDLDEGKVGTYDARGDGIIRVDEASAGRCAEIKWLTGNVEFEDTDGKRWS